MRTTCLGVLVAAWLDLTGLAAAEDVLLSGEDPALASPAGRLAIGRAAEYVPTSVPEPALKVLLRDSMKERRDLAWSIVEQMLIPTIITSQDASGNPTTIKVPRWQTWYEGLSGGNDTNFDEITPIITAYLTKLNASPDRPVDELIDEVINEHAIKDLEPTLTDENFQTVLNQNLGTGLLESDEVLGGKGFTLFSPSFMKHILREAQLIHECQINLPAATTLPNPDNFSNCMSQEFPRSAVTVKTTWQPLDRPFPLQDTTPLAVDAAIREGTWPGAVYPDLVPPVGPDKLPLGVLADESQIYTNVSTGGRKFGLTGIHFVTKDVREWVWVTLWWDPNARNEDFGTDQPASIAGYNGGVWQNYKLCVNSAFIEGDAAPGSHYSGPQQPLAEALEAAYAALVDQARNGASATSAFAPVNPTPFADALMPAAAPNDVPTQWCSNPNVEWHQGNSRTSCIGCHQVVFTENERRSEEAAFFHILVGDYAQFGRAQARNNFPGEFVWSFTGEFRRVIRRAVQGIPGFSWP